MHTAGCSGARIGLRCNARPKQRARTSNAGAIRPRAQAQAAGQACSWPMQVVATAVAVVKELEGFVQQR